MYSKHEIKRNMPLSCLLFACIFLGCKKNVDVDPPGTSINAANVYSNDATAAAVLTGIYTTMSSGSFSLGSFTSIPLLAGLSADELTLNSGSSNTNYVQYYTNALVSTVTINANPWYNTYPYIFTCNSAIEGLNSSTTLTPGVKHQLLGEAKFMRAFFYFYLVNLYGEVPMPLSSDYTINAALARNTKTNLYLQIIADLKDAQKLLSANFLDGTLLNRTTERVRPTAWAATALLSRVYLYTGDWVNAEVQSGSVINNVSTFSLVTGLNNVFLKNSSETIWQLQPVNSGQNTQEALLYILPASGPNTGTFPIYLNETLINSFEPGDQRRSNWINSVIVSGKTYYYPYKYKINTLNTPVREYIMMLRLAEQYLIRAETRAQQNNIVGALSDLNIIRTRAGLPNITANDKKFILTAVLQERKVELFTEWGHRWLDLKRTSNVDSVMSIITPQKGGTWNTNWQWYPIPAQEIQKDPNLNQSSGY